MRLALTVRFFSIAALAGALSFGCASTTPSQPEAGGAAAASPSPSPTPAVSGMQKFAPDMVNTPDAQRAPYVVLLSIDGYRYDYTRLHKPPNLGKLASEGVAAESLRPPYPSKTFPSHYSIATGLTPDRHGIVSNEFYDPARDGIYALKDRAAVEDGSWYKGEPLWVRAHLAGMMTASFFWVGSESAIGGVRPNYYYRYDETVPGATRVDQVLDWLNMPPETRPHLITLYFSDVDTAGHKHGPTSEQVKAAVLSVDEQIGRLREGIAKTGLPVNLVVVSDHGMEALDPKKVIAIDDDATASNFLSKFRIFGRGPQMILYLKQGEEREAIRALERVLERKAKNFRVRNRDELKKLRYFASDRVGDLVIEPDPGYMVGLRSALPEGTGGNHGWDPALTKNMHGIFYAEGPGLKAKTKLPTIEGIDVYPFVLDLLGVQSPPGIDGRLEATRQARVARAKPGK